MIKYLQILFVSLLVVISFRFFDAQFLNHSIINYSVFIAVSGSIILSIPFVMPRSEGFVLPVQLIIISIVVSIFMANITWDQSYKESIMETMPYMIFIVFFYLLHIRIPVKIIENIILVYGALYVILYFYQLLHSPTVFFGKSLWGDEFSIDRGITRIIFPGAGIFILSVFIAITRLTTQVKGRWVWLLFSVLGVVIPVLQVTRQFIAGVLLIYLFHFLKNQHFIKKVFIIAVFAGAFLFISNLDNPVIKGIREAAKDDFRQGDDYIRVQAGTYFLTNFSQDNMSRILGNGAPYYGISNYGILIENIQVQQGYYLEDVGLIGMYAMFGILAVIGYVLIWVKSFTIPLPKNYYYLKYYLWYLLLTSLTWYSVYHYSYLISTTFVLYLYQFIYKKEQLKVNE